MSFDSFDLHPQIAAGVQALGYSTPTPIQRRAIPPVLQGQDVLGLAQTGTGKTAAFVLPILQRLVKTPRGCIRALVIAPTRELSDQINTTFETLGRQTHLRSLPIYGGVPMAPQVRKLRSGVEIVVACPGRLLDHIRQGTIRLSNLEVLVLDEADRMLDMGFLPDIREILKHVPTVRQTLMFAATMPDDIRRLAKDVLRTPVTVQVNSPAPAAYGRARALPGRLSPQDRTSPSTVAPYRNGLRPDLHADQTPGPAFGRSDRKGRLPDHIASGKPISEPAPGGHPRIP